MESWLSWVIVLAIAAGAYYYYSPKNAFRQNRRGRPRQPAPATSARSQPEWSDAELQTSVGKAAKPKEKRKSVKKTIQEVADKTEAYLSQASSTAGVDADDDLSPAVSPALDAITNKAPSGRDVSDMLEPSGSAPSVLRLTPGKEPARQNKKSPQGAPKEPTKKQRQNKKKAEEAKAQREEDERERQVLLEKQKRTAREARGEPAKNGLRPSQAPSANPWSARPNSGAVGGNNAQLLDTFDADIVSTGSSEHATNGTSTTNSLSNSAHWTTLPSEEEQIRMAIEDSEWTTVPKGRKQRKQRANTIGDTTSEEGNDNTAPLQEVVAPVKKAPATAPAVEPSSRFSVLDTNPTESSSHPMDSDWPVV